MLRASASHLNKRAHAFTKDSLIAENFSEPGGHYRAIRPNLSDGKRQRTQNVVECDFVTPPMLDRPKRLFESPHGSSANSGPAVSPSRTSKVLFDASPPSGRRVVDNEGDIAEDQRRVATTPEGMKIIWADQPKITGTKGVFDPSDPLSALTADYPIELMEVLVVL